MSTLAPLRVLLIHAGTLPHYRIPIYAYLQEDLKNHGFSLSVISDAIETDDPGSVGFRYTRMDLSASRILRYVKGREIDVIIDFMALKHAYLFPVYLVAKGIYGRKIVYWGQGRDLLDAGAALKNLGYAVQLGLSDAIVLYGEHLRKYVPATLRHKVFIANNTLYFGPGERRSGMTKEAVLAAFGIGTSKNVICVGRMQKRKRIGHLVEAFRMMRRQDTGLILAGPDPERILDAIEGDGIYKIGPVYGERKFDLLSSADVYCLPGAVGLSIVDAFHCGLPFITEEGDESAEIMYLRDGINGFIVPRNDIRSLSDRMRLLLDDDDRRRRFSEAGRREIEERGSMEVFCAGFRKALSYATRRIGRGRDLGSSGRAGFIDL